MKRFFTVKTFLFILILVGAAYMRLWSVPEFFSFNFDEEYQASLAWSIVKDFHVIWIGVSASNVGYYLGPGFTYLNAFLFWLSQGNPVSIAYFSPLLGLVTTVSIFYITRKLFTEKAAYIAMSLYGFSALIAFFDRRFWNPTPIPFIALWMVYSLAMGRKNPWWYVLSAFLYGLSLHTHLSLVIFAPIILFELVVNRKRIQWKTWGSMIAAYLAVTFPMLVFDIAHNFDNLRAPLRFFEKGGSDPVTVSSFARAVNYATTYFSTLGRTWYLRPYTTLQDEHGLGTHGLTSVGHPIFALISLASIGYLTTKAVKNINARLVIAPIILLSITFIFYPGVAGEYYLLGLVALIPIAVGVMLERVPPHALILLFSFIFLINAYTIAFSNQGMYGLRVRKQVIERVTKAVGESDFYLETIGRDPRKYHPYGGWRYLFKEYGKAPAQSHADEFFGWIYPDEIKSMPPRLRVVIAEETAYQPKTPVIMQFTAGAFNVYVVENVQ
jgi:4-amino-4-deoxy-L-arabinose transferase-like glycosyltransferase